jgi:mono/diheme cytochrome c family protein
MSIETEPEVEKPGRLAAAGVFVAFVIAAVAGSIVVYSLSGWGVPDKVKNTKNPFPSTPEAMVGAAVDYAAHCKSCHGANGDGRGERAERLSIAPADLRDAHALGLRTDGELFWIISEGHKPMPAFRGTLSEEQRWHLVDYVRLFTRQ